MQQRSPALVFFLSLITFGIYALYWEVKTKGELNRLGASIPTAWLLIVPLANLYWVWKYCEGVEKVSGGQISAVLALILMLLLSIVGIAIMQSEFNKLGALQPQAEGAGPFPAPPTVAGAPIDPGQPPVQPDAPAPSYPPAPAVDNPPSSPPEPPATPPTLPPSPI